MNTLTLDRPAAEELIVSRRLHRTVWNDGVAPGDTDRQDRSCSEAAMVTQDAGKILVIEDDPDTRANLRDILEMDGYEVKTAATARQAMDQGLGEFLAILLDRQLPDGNADTLLPQIKRNAPKAEVIIITGHADLQGTIAALRHGASDFLPKPIDGDVLRAALARVARFKEAERRAQQAERLAAIGQAAAALSHEARNDLWTLKMCLEILPMTLDDRDATLKLVADSQICERRLERLFEDVRGFAAPIQLEQSVCDLRDIWRKAWSSLQSNWKKRDVSFDEEINGASLHLPGDAFRLEQVFRNLFENALSACPDPVRVEIRCSEVNHQGQPTLRLVVADNGPGLTVEQRQKAFEPFYTTKSKGTGLGLAICRRIIEAHGGQMNLGDGRRGGQISIILPSKAGVKAWSNDDSPTR